MQRTNAKMMNSAHLYGHHQFNPQADSSWMHQQQQAVQQYSRAQQQQQAQQAQQAQAQAQQQQAQQQQQQQAQQAQQAQQQQANQDGVTAGSDNMSEENRRTMGYIADLLNENTREAALLELSKKREQVPELALILWHSFGES